MFLETMLFLISVWLMFLGTIALTAPSYAREYFHKHYRFKKPERWYDYLWYVKRPLPLWLIQLLGVISMFVSMLSLFIFFKRTGLMR